MSLPIVIVGAGGHAIVVSEIIQATGNYEIIGCTDPRQDNALADLGIKYLGGDDVLPAVKRAGVDMAAMGMAGFNNDYRRKLYEKVLSLGFNFPVLRHPAAIIASGATLGNGVVIMAGAVINPAVTVGANVIINTGAIIEHGCRIGHSAQVGPGAILCGSVIVAEEAFIGAGACVIQGKRIGRGAIVGAGAVVIDDVPAGATVAGNPARVRS
ncbi:acetyltransferase [Moorella naiadis]|uniref:acetyltransferase n=1 Tax=Moorella naiadis (nom. illeg.) TaxID=3093670 RepID=UPI003D9CAFF4